WNISIRNDGYNASNVWINPQAVTNRVTITNIYDVTNPSNPFPVLNNIFQIGNIAGGETRNYIACGTYLCGDPVATEQVRFFTGWGCDGYPQYFASACPQQADY